VIEPLHTHTHTYRSAFSVNCIANTYAKAGASRTAPNALIAIGAGTIDGGGMGGMGGMGAGIASGMGSGAGIGTGIGTGMSTGMGMRMNSGMAAGIAGMDTRDRRGTSALASSSAREDTWTSLWSRRLSSMQFR
ncbi:hypothetical protein B484DRAFT_389187, partial [Ochromonadaceae sp. CCMP2298]